MIIEALFLYMYFCSVCVGPCKGSFTQEGQNCKEVIEDIINTAVVGTLSLDNCIIYKSNQGGILEDFDLDLAGNEKDALFKVLGPKGLVYIIVPKEVQFRAISMATSTATSTPMNSVPASPMCISGHTAAQSQESTLSDISENWQVSVNQHMKCVDPVEIVVL